MAALLCVGSRGSMALAREASTAAAAAVAAAAPAAAAAALLQLLPSRRQRGGDLAVAADCRTLSSSNCSSSPSSSSSVGARPTPGDDGAAASPSSPSSSSSGRCSAVGPPQVLQRQRHQQQQRCRHVWNFGESFAARAATERRGLSTDAAAAPTAGADADAGADGGSSSSSAAADSSSSSSVVADSAAAEVDQLLRVLLQPLHRAPAWNGQLSPHLLDLGEQLLVQPDAVLASVLRALHVVRGVLQDDGHVYVVDGGKLLRPLVRAAARGCVNPNVWFYHAAWAPGMLTNHASHGRLFKESHQPNRRLFAAKGLRMVNPLCPEPPPAAAPLPRLSWDDKWRLFQRSRRPGYRRLLTELLAAEDALHRFKPAGSLRGTPRALRLLVALDADRSRVALREAFHRNVPTIALASSTSDMRLVTYPVLARGGSPEFARFFLEWLLRVANARPNDAPAAQRQLLQAAPAAAAAGDAGGAGDAPPAGAAAGAGER